MSSSPATPRRSPPWHHSLIADPAHAARAGTSLLLGILMAWSLGAYDFGVLQAAFALAVLLSAATSLGMDPAVRAQLRNQPYETASTLGTAMALRCGLGLLVYVGLLSFTSRTQSTPQSIWLVGGLMVLMQTPLLLGLRLEEAGHRARADLARYLGFALSSLLVLAMIWRNADTVWFACAIVLEQPIVALVMLFDHGRIAPEEESFTWEWDVARNWLRQSKKTWHSALIPWLLVPVSLLALIAVSTPKQAGQFGVAIVLFEAAAFCASAILAGYLADPTSKADHDFNRSALVGWTCAASVAAVSILLGFTLLRSGFGGLPVIGSLVGLALVPHTLGLARDAQTSADLQQKQRTRTRLVIAGVNLVFGLVLSHRFGAIGAAAALLVSTLAGELIVPLFFASERKLARSQGKALILWSRWHGAKTPVPVATPVMNPEIPLSVDTPDSTAMATVRVRLARSADSIDTVPPTGAIAKSS